jgi:hypothetical protein
MEATPHPAEDIRALAAQFEAAWQAERVFFHGGGTDEEANAAIDAVKALAQKIIAVPGTDISIMRLKARVYLWAEATDLEKLAAEGGDWPSEAVLASLFRDLGVAGLDATTEPATPTDRPRPHPDAPLIALAAMCETAAQRFKAASDEYARAEFAVVHDGVRDIAEVLGTSKSQVARDVPNGTIEQAKSSEPDVVSVPNGTVIDAVAALSATDDVRKAANKKARKAGAKESKEALRIQNITLDELWDILMPTVWMRASSVDGLLAKARALRSAFPDDTAIAEMIAEALRVDGPFEPLPASLSLARDLLALAEVANG